MRDLNFVDKVVSPDHLQLNLVQFVRRDYVTVSIK